MHLVSRRLLTSAVPVVLCLIAALLLPTTGRAAWPSDPALNFAIADGAGEQVVPKIAVRSDGGCYVGWYDNRTGNYDIRLQRLDAAGNEIWPHNGILVSGQPQDTWVSDWDLICDAQGNCVLTFTDIRSGNWDVQAYKVNADGTFPWGANGINLSQNAAFEPSPTCCQASNGEYVFAWGRYPDAGGGAMMMQRLTPEGLLRYPVGGLAVIAQGTEEPGFPDLEPSLDSDVLLMYVRDISAYTSPRHIRMQRYNAAGAAVWATYTAIFDATAVPMGYAPHIQTDSAGGAVCGWHRASGNLLSIFVQHVNASGVELFAHNGVSVTTDVTRNHIDPATAYNASTGEIFVFWNERNLNQDQWGIYGQRLSSTGVKMWSATGLVLQPVNAVYKTYPRSVPLGDGAVCFFGDNGGNRLVAYRLNAAGANVWATVPLLVSTAPSSKARLPLCIDATGTTRIIWEDDRNGTPDVYGQSVNADGTLGANSEGVPEATVWSVAFCQPNPFRSSTRISLRDGAGEPRRLLLATADGRIVRETEVSAANGTLRSWSWDGCDGSGRELPAGVYLYRWVTTAGAEISGSVVLVR